MKYIFLTGVLLISTNVMANNVKINEMDLLKQKNCLACHAVDKKLVGPAFKDIAKKYNAENKITDFSNDKTVLALSQKVLKGTSGVWGAIPMPANAQVKEEEAKILVSYILKIK